MKNSLQAFTGFVKLASYQNCFLFECASAREIEKNDKIDFQEHVS